MSPAEAERVSAAEEAADTIVQMKVLEQTFTADLGAKQAAQEEQMKLALLAMKERHEGTLSSLETGLAAQQAKKQKALEERLRKKKADKVKEALASGLSQQEAERAVDADEEIKQLVADEQRDKALADANLVDARKALNIAVEHLLSEREQMLRDDYERDLALLPQRMQTELSTRMLEEAATLGLARDARVEELMGEGVSREDASRQAQEEYEVALAATRVELEKKLAEKEREMAAKLKKKLDADMKDVDQMRANGARILEVGLDALKEQQHELLAQKAAEVRAQQEKSLIAKGVDPEEARKQAAEKAQRDLDKATAKLDGQIDRTAGMIKAAAKEENERNIQEMKAEAERKLKGLDAYNEAKKAEELKRTLDRLARRKKQRERGLVGAGFTAQDAQAIAEKELGDGAEAIAAIGARLDADVSKLKDRYAPSPPSSLLLSISTLALCITCITLTAMFFESILT